MSASDTVCCPPAAPRPKVAHPVAEASGYELKGSYEKVGDFDKVYVVSSLAFDFSSPQTGPDNAEHAVVVIYDIFGFW